MAIRYLPKSNVIKTPAPGKFSSGNRVTARQIQAARGSGGGGGGNSSGGGESGGGEAMGGMAFGTGAADMPWLLDEIKKWTAGEYGMPDSVKNAMINNVRSRLYGEAYGDDYNPDTNQLREGGTYGGLYKTMLRDMNKRGMYQSGLATEEQGKINQAVLKDLSSTQQQYDMQQFNTNQQGRQFGIGAGLGYRSGDISLAAQSLQAKLASDALAQSAQQNALDRELQKYLAQYQSSQANSAAGANAIGGLLGSAGSIGMMKIFFGCFSQETPVTLLDEDDSEIEVTISDVMVGDLVKTDDGFKRVTGVFSYDERGLISVNDIRCTEEHPFIMQDGELKIAGQLEEGDVLYDGIEVENIAKGGMDYVFNIEVEGHKFYVGDMLVHDGREVK